MTTMNISLPNALKSCVDARVAAGDSTSSEFARKPFRNEKDRETLCKMSPEGANSGVGVETDAVFLDRLRAKVRGTPVG